METLYEITSVELVRPIYKVNIPAYTTDIVGLKADLKRNSGASQVVLKCAKVERNLDRIKNIKEKRSKYFSRMDHLKHSNNTPSRFVVDYVNSVDWIESVEERDMWINALTRAENWGN